MNYDESEILYDERGICYKNFTMNDCFPDTHTQRNFPDKVRNREGNIGYFNGSYSEIEVAQNRLWGPNEI